MGWVKSVRSWRMSSAGDAHGWIGVMEATEAKLKDKNS
jgi:hypothetical protein